MAINSVGSTSSAVQQPLMAAKQSQPEMAEYPHENIDAARAREAQVATNQQAQVRRAEISKQAERPERTEQHRPVVNAQGQKTGTIINTTA